MDHNYIFSEKIDKAVFIIIFIFILLTSYRIVVYSNILISDINLVEIKPDGKRINMPIENLNMIIYRGNVSENVLWRTTKNTIDNFIVRFGKYRTYKPGTKIIWKINYSYNSTKKNNIKMFIYEADKNGRLNFKSQK